MVTEPGAFVQIQLNRNWLSKTFYLFSYFYQKTRWKLVNNNETSKIITETLEVKSGQESSLVSDIDEVGENENEIFRDNDGWDLL